MNSRVLELCRMIVDNPLDPGAIRMSALHEQYALGRSPQEYARLTRQAEMLKPMTRRLFAEAGIEPGMRVVDLGSGAGDICILLSEIVGSGGSVIRCRRRRISPRPRASLRCGSAECHVRSFRLRALYSERTRRCDCGTSCAYVSERSGCGFDETHTASSSRRCGRVPRALVSVSTGP